MQSDALVLSVTEGPSTPIKPIKLLKKGDVDVEDLTVVQLREQLELRNKRNPVFSAKAFDIYVELLALHNRYAAAQRAV